MIQPVLRHLARLGGVIVAPRATLTRLLRAPEGQMWELLPWFVVVTAVLSPTGAGRALLVCRVGVLDGLLLFVNLIAGRMLGPMIGLFVAASILHLVDRLRFRGALQVPFDVALDATAFTLVPFLLLACVGALLSQLGLELTVFPHRSLQVAGWLGAARVATAFGWPVVLFGILLKEVWTRPGAAGANSSAP